MTGIIVLCRYNSSRLYGKILKKINGKEILQYIFERLEELNENHPIVVCTSVEETDDPIIDFCRNNNIDFFRGSLENVAERFLSCAKIYNLENAVRINGDNLFLDSELIKQMIGVIETKKAMFVSNVKDRTFPKGMSVEIVNVEFYQKHYPRFLPEDLEHVMTYFYRLNEKNAGIEYVYNESEYSEKINLAIDTQEDFDNANSIINMMGKNHKEYGYKEIVTLFNNVIDNE